MKSRDRGKKQASSYESVKYALVDADHAGRRVDNYLDSLLENVPRSRIYQMLRRGEVRVDGRRVKQGYRLQKGEKLRIPPVMSQDKAAPPGPRRYLLERIEKSIIYEDDNLLVVNKPAGIPVHGGTGRTYGVIELLRILLKDTPSEMHLAHRLDRETSGVLLIAKNMKYLTFLNECFKARRVKKHYLALLHGRLDKKVITVNKNLSRNRVRGGERLSALDSEGKDADTIFRRIRYIGDSTLADVEIKTGRTHQIRVHAASISHPVAGDDKYGMKTYNSTLGKTGLKRLFLHAESITIPAFKGKKPMSLHAPLPEDLQDFLHSYASPG